MRDWVGEWVQEGRLCVWRYAGARRGWRGWQWAADPPGARSVRNLLDRMQGGDACNRDVRLEPVTDGILSVPNAGYPVADQLVRLVVQYRPAIATLQLFPDEDETLYLSVGGRHLRKLAAALTEVEVGRGDFGIQATTSRTPDPWMFWWMPDVDYSDRKRL